MNIMHSGQLQVAHSKFLSSPATCKDHLNQPMTDDQAGQLTLKTTASNRTISIKLVDSQSQ
ncbi:conserved hypothetical protein [Trichinella spiralis]|uniref:hypothetical protein n=1 Tax=Trichinella spiralis TaxID=6334 RepID=UPI0001EFBB4A|nr:conserved hypothetical protein [Trichinella spiralis]